MARRTFSSDFRHALPKGKREPYRLWFEYLKIADVLIPDKIDRSYYADWGDITEFPFDEWFEKNWRMLFAIPASVTILQTLDDFRAAEADEDCVVIKISRAGTTTQKLDDLKKLIEAQFADKKAIKVEKPKYEISAKRSVHFPSLRAKLRFLEIFQTQKTVESTTLRYLEWAEGWNAKFAKRSSRRVSVPKSITRFGKSLRAYQAEITRLGRVKKTPEYNAARSDMVRFLKSAEKIMLNTAQGSFPGIS